MVKSISGDAHHLRVVSIKDGYGALQPKLRDHTRPLWLPLRLLFEWDSGLFEEIQAAYIKRDVSLVNKLWARAKQISNDTFGSTL